MGVEASIGEMSRAEKGIQNILKGSGYASLADFVKFQTDGKEKIMAEKLLFALARYDKVLRKKLTSAKASLKRSKEFIDFNVNIMAHASAGTTYAPPGGSTKGAAARKLFEANV